MVASWWSWPPSGTSHSSTPRHVLLHVHLLSNILNINPGRYGRRRLQSRLTVPSRGCSRTSSKISTTSTRLPQHHAITFLRNIVLLPRRLRHDASTLSRTRRSSRTSTPSTASSPSQPPSRSRTASRTSTSIRYAATQLQHLLHPLRSLYRRGHGRVRCGSPVRLS